MVDVEGCAYSLSLLRVHVGLPFRHHSRRWPPRIGWLAPAGREHSYKRPRPQWRYEVWGPVYRNMHSVWSGSSCLQWQQASTSPSQTHPPLSSRPQLAPPSTSPQYKQRSYWNIYIRKVNFSDSQLWLCKYLRLGSTVVLPHHIQWVEAWDWLEGVQSHQGASSIGVKHLQNVPGLQTFQHYSRESIKNH